MRALIYKLDNLSTYSSIFFSMAFNSCLVAKFSINYFFKVVMGSLAAYPAFSAANKGEKKETVDTDEFEG